MGIVETHYVFVYYDVDCDLTHKTDYGDDKFRVISEFPQRDETLGDFLKEYSESGSMDHMNINHYTGPFNDNYNHIHGEKETYSIRLEGTKNQIQSFVKAVAEEEYGLPTVDGWLANYEHPIGSYLGYRDVKNAISELEKTIETVVIREELDRNFFKDTITFEKK